METALKRRTNMLIGLLVMTTDVYLSTPHHKILDLLIRRIYNEKGSFVIA